MIWPRSRRTSSRSRGPTRRPDWSIHSAGPGGLLAAFIDSFAGIDGTLLFAAGGVVILILLVVYRSPSLWFFPLFSAVVALGAASLIIYYLAKHNVLTLNGQSQGILDVLVLGAGTDYALLLVSRYREELHAYESRVTRDDGGLARGRAGDRRVGDHGHPRPAVPDLRRAQLRPQPRPGLRDRHRLHASASCSPSCRWPS